MRIINKIFTAIGMLVTISLLSGLLIGYWYTKEETLQLPDKMILSFDFRVQTPEQTQSNALLDTLTEKQLFPFRYLITALDRASKDDRVKGFVALVSDAELDHAQINELRDAISRFRANGKFAYAFADSLGEGSNSERAYWLAAAFEKIWLQPLGIITLNGPSLTVPFAGDLLKKIGILADMHQRYEYKGIADTFTKNEMPAPIRENYDKLLSDIKTEMVENISNDRHVPKNTVSSLMDKGFLFDKEALKAGLIDHIDYRDQMEEAATEKAGAEAENTDIIDYFYNSSSIAAKDKKPVQKDAVAVNSPPAPLAPISNMSDTQGQEKAVAKVETPDASSPSNSPLLPEKPAKPETSLHPDAEKKPAKESKDPLKVALIYVDGPIVRLDDERGPFGENQVASAETIAHALQTATHDESISGIVLRVNSPGGSVTASETIYSAMMQAREHGKYIVVSMGGLAASGGYWIATAADKIVADPTTITGSIGVASGKFVMQGLYDKLGVKWGEVSSSKNATIWSPTHPFNPEQMQRINQSLDLVYNEFLIRVSESRNISVTDLDKLARGRVWLGRTAHKLGLVDELGGLRTAFKIVREHANLPEGSHVMIVTLPAEKSTTEQIMSLLKAFMMVPSSVSMILSGNFSGLVEMWGGKSIFFGSAFTTNALNAGSFEIN